MSRQYKPQANRLSRALFPLTIDTSEITIDKMAELLEQLMTGEQKEKAMKLGQIGISNHDSVPFVKLSTLADAGIVFDIVGAVQGEKPDFYNPRQMNTVYTFTVVQEDGHKGKFEARDSEYWAETYAAIKAVVEADDKVEDCIAVARSFTPKGKQEPITYYRLSEAPEKAIAKQQAFEEDFLQSLNEGSTAHDHESLDAVQAQPSKAAPAHQEPIAIPARQAQRNRGKVPA